MTFRARSVKRSYITNTYPWSTFLCLPYRTTAYQIFRSPDLLIKPTVKAKAVDTISMQTVRHCQSMQAKERLKVHFLKPQLRHTLNRRFGFYRLGEKTGIGASTIQPRKFRNFSMLPNGQATFTSRCRMDCHSDSFAADFMRQRPHDLSLYFRIQRFPDR